ncbi:MAG: hypothetical protein FWF50_02530 [Defluviitaleaceae bacterium]|nr:hypothetical protein [Defluviitaleaceae bacterium]
MKKYFATLLIFILGFTTTELRGESSEKNYKLNDYQLEIDIPIYNFQEHLVYNLDEVINYEIININGVPMLFVVYEDFLGGLTEVVYLLENSHGKMAIKYTYDREALDYYFIEKMVSVSNHRLYSLIGAAPINKLWDSTVSPVETYLSYNISAFRTVYERYAVSNISKLKQCNIRS